MPDNGNGISGTALFVVVAGSVLAYSGLKGKSISTSIRALLAGQNPANAPQDPSLAIAILPSAPAAADDKTKTPAPGFGNYAVPAGSNIVTAAALSQLGKPYVWATPVSASDPNPKSFDCSGLTMWAYNKANIKLTHFTGAQYLELAHRPYAQAQPGDLVFYQNFTGSIYHVQMYLGGGTVIEAPQSGIPVRTRLLSPNEPDRMASVGVYPGGR